MHNSPLIITAKMDAATFEFFDDLRRAHFPGEKNFLSAHITLFHQLPGEYLDQIEDHLKEVAARQQEIKLFFPDLEFIGRGSIARIESPPLRSLRNKLANHWSDWLTPQDRQHNPLHITIQNKATPDEARLLFEELRAGWKPITGAATALQLWHYRNGPWQLANEFVFYQSPDAE